MGVKIKKRSKDSKNRSSKKKFKKAKKRAAKKKEELRQLEEISRQKRRQRAVKLRAEGYTYPMIAKDLNVSVKTAWKYVTQAVAKYNKKYPEEVEKLRTIDLNRTDKIIRKGMVLLNSPDSQDQAIGMQNIMKAMELRAKYIPRLHTPKQMQFGLDDELREKMENVDKSVVDILKKLVGQGEEE